MDDWTNRQMDKQMDGEGWVDGKTARYKVLTKKS